VAKRILTIDPDLMADSREYVRKQLSVMGQKLSDEKFEEVAYKCAVYPQELRNLKAKGLK
jgi:hypothetical protein